jgi:hypothetical protein
MQQLMVNLQLSEWDIIFIISLVFGGKNGLVYIIKVSVITVEILA